MKNDDRLHPEYVLAQWMWNPESSFAALCALVHTTLCKPAAVDGVIATYF